MDKQIIIALFIGFALLGFVVMNNTPENKEKDKNKEWTVIFIQIKSDFQIENVRYIDWIRGIHGNPNEKDRKGGENIYESLRELERRLHFQNDQFQNESAGNSYPEFQTLANDIGNAIGQVGKTLATVPHEDVNELEMSDLSIQGRPKSVNTGVVNNYFGAYTGPVTTDARTDARQHSESYVGGTNTQVDSRVDSRRTSEWLDQSVGPQSLTQTDARTGGAITKTQTIGAKTLTQTDARRTSDARNFSQIGGTATFAPTQIDGNKTSVGGTFAPTNAQGYVMDARGYLSLNNTKLIGPTDDAPKDFGSIGNAPIENTHDPKPPGPPSNAPKTILTPENQIPPNLELDGLAAHQTKNTNHILAKPPIVVDKPPAIPGIPKPQPKPTGFAQIFSPTEVAQPVENPHAGDVNNGTSMVREDLIDVQEDKQMTKINQKKRVNRPETVSIDITGGGKPPVKRVKQIRTQSNIPFPNVVEIETDATQTLPNGDPVSSHETVLERSRDNMKPARTSNQAQQRRGVRKPKASKTNAKGRLDGYEKTLQGKAYQVEVIGKRIIGSEYPSKEDIKQFWKLYNDLAYTTPVQIEIIDRKEKKIIQPPDNGFFVNIHQGKDLKYKESFTLDDETIETINQFLNHYNSDFDTIKTKSPEFAVWNSVMKNIEAVRQKVPLK